LNVPEVTKHLGEDPDLFRWLLEDQQGPYKHTFWPIELKGTGEFVGICGLVTVDEQDSTVLGATELGYRIKPVAQGNRYAIEASAACIKFAFERENVWWVVSRTILENSPSWSVMKAIGMRHDPRPDYVSNRKTPYIVHVMTLDEWETGGRDLCRSILTNPTQRPRRGSRKMRSFLDQ
jgi:RimJ/RimL family protein N-acetyltransferase